MPLLELHYLSSLTILADFKRASVSLRRLYPKVGMANLLNMDGGLAFGFLTCEVPRMEGDPGFSGFVEILSFFLKLKCPFLVTSQERAQREWTP
nr:hypothetical protein Iba_chr11aCG17550 [Ipomoea batatas]